MEEADGWLLRASPAVAADGTRTGFTGRGNSALVLTAPDGLDDLVSRLDAVRAWYADHGLAPRLAVPLPHFARLADHLVASGWQFAHGGRVLVTTLDAVAHGEQTHSVAIAAAPDPAWCDQYHYRGGSLPDVGRRMLTRGDQVGFASIRADGEVVAIGRGSITAGWLGVNAVEVAASHRRQGMAGAVLAALASWAQDRGAANVFLQVDLANRVAHAMYLDAGFRQHHTYRYMTPVGT